MIHDKTIRVGACDWDHTRWQGDFYPDDLPAEWRLSYYANEFSAVLVPEAKWRAQDGNADFAQWAEDVPEGFRFYFLSSKKDNKEADIKAVLGDKFAGFVNPDEESAIALIKYQAKNLREWKVWLQSVKPDTIFLIDENLKPAQLSDFQSLIELMNL